MRIRNVAIAAGLLAAALAIGSAAAGEDREEHARDREHEEQGSRREVAAPTAEYAKECGACHVAYPPAFLPAGAWRRLMAGLDRHFGQDAALDEAARARLERWVLGGAGAEPPLRITEQGWFREEHRELPPGAAARPSIRSMASCTACHAGAARWDFDEDRVRIPGG
jgi:hypothetical protein